MAEEKNNRGGVMPPPSKHEQPEDESPKVEEKSAPIQVVAKQAGFYGNVRRKEGDKFTIAGEKQFSKIWMKKI
jgi:hypothetical protein